MFHANSREDMPNDGVKTLQVVDYRSIKIP